MRKARVILFLTAGLVLLASPLFAATVRKAPVGSLIIPEHYVIQRGDTLTGLAKKFYGRARYYRVLAVSNRIKNPDLIFAGRALYLPPREAVLAASGSEKTAKRGNHKFPFLAAVPEVLPYLLPNVCVCSMRVIAEHPALLALVGIGPMAGLLESLPEAGREAILASLEQGYALSLPKAVSFDPNGSQPARTGIKTFGDLNSALSIYSGLLAEGVRNRASPASPEAVKAAAVIPGCQRLTVQAIRENREAAKLLAKIYFFDLVHQAGALKALWRVFREYGSGP